MPSPKRQCSEPECSKPSYKDVLCHAHYQASWSSEMGPKCNVDDCAKPTKTRGWCYLHYQRWLRYGDPTAVKQIQGDAQRRLMSHVDKRGDDECWPWTGSIGKRGYGYASKGGRMGSAPAHRTIYETFVGSIPQGMDIDHLCHDPKTCVGGDTCPHRRCCNPKHLAPEEPVANTMRGNSPAAITPRKTHCKNGHPFDEANTIINKNGKRTCRRCRSDWRKRRWAAGLSR